MNARLIIFISCFLVSFHCISAQSKEFSLSRAMSSTDGLHLKGLSLEFNKQVNHRRTIGATIMGLYGETDGLFYIVGQRKIYQFMLSDQYQMTPTSWRFKAGLKTSICASYAQKHDFSVLSYIDIHFNHMAAIYKSGFFPGINQSLTLKCPLFKGIFIGGEVGIGRYFRSSASFWNTYCSLGIGYRFMTKK